MTSRVFLCAVALLSCDARANPAPAIRDLRVPAEAIAAQAPVSTDTRSPLDLAREALLRGDAASARRLAEDALPSATGAEMLRLRFAAGLACVGTNDVDSALRHYAVVADDPTHPLARWAALERATLLEERDPATAIALVEGLDDPWAGRDRARRIEARARLATGDEARALPLLRALVTETRDTSGAASIALPLADFLATKDDPASLEEALRLYRRVASRAPRAREGLEAATKAERVLVRLPAARRTELAELSVDDALARAQALAASMRTQDAEEAFASVLARLDEGDPRRCDALLGRARMVERGRDRARTAQVLDALAADCPAEETVAWALYKSGRAHAAQGQLDAAIERYERVEQAAPRNRYADDAAYFAAIADREAGRLDSMKARLAALPARYPQGDMRADALFLLAWKAREDGAFDEALTHLERSVALVPMEDGEDLLGRARYWRARTLADLGRTDEAKAAYADVVRAFPLGYYAQLALSKLRPLDEAEATRVVESIRSEATPMRAPTADRGDRAAFERAKELLGVGALDDALLELAAYGTTRDGADDETLILGAELLEATGYHGEAARLVRRRYAAFRTQAPKGAMRDRWRAAYPLAYAPLIEESANRESVPAAFVRAIAREESSFDPNAVSRAHAYGLIQIILPTARGQASHVGIEPTAENLRDPETNLRFGTRFMRWLFERYQANPALVPPAYNAGHGAVDRWLRQDRERPFDVFVEEIPYEETRRYTRRVLQSYGIYSFLDTGTLPDIPEQLPR